MKWLWVVETCDLSCGELLGC